METMNPAAAVGRTTSRDRVRQVTVLVGAAVAIVGATIGSGAFGGQPVAEAAGGALSATATPVAPDSPAFSIWSVIYTGLAVFAVVQALPRQGADPRLRAISWWVLASMLLNALWIGAVQADSVAGSVVVIVVLLAVLATMYVKLVRMPHTATAPSVITDVTVGLYTGWVSVATLANTAAFLAYAEVGELGLGATGWSVVLVSAAALLAVAYGAYGRRRPALVIPIGLAMGWGLMWIGLGRTNGPLVDETVATAAFAAAVVAALAPVIASLTARRSATR
ncbi:tryptophan-rich sensory protein [Cellulomonas wangsupingiae]|uniref:Tryptophan-rich sensory protein n=1 Tax=Cellulomonas wangsupingiae TaxID=2968085 RepID=A0ABY5K6N3_9CELL|nr:tryptophan-rich sensory protein [Cellulomonas wangsupingiae]MCC2334955.1 tryptophan-rich sensory protein [Cellulomonas wangsupingiae]MCM0638827.1 tryptophan-rich sensory protein [Cellulomonas wangsupingiae]UUI65454.1 tryptophan-rich sensory protein [Cellulomonas wangsupingiae]